MKKSQASIASAWERRNRDQVGAVRRGAGSIPAFFRISHAVDAATFTPRPVPRPPVLTWGSTRPAVFAEEAAEDGPALDPLPGEAGDRVIGPGRAEFPAAMGSSPVVVRRVRGQDQAQVPLAEDQHPVGHLRPGGEHEPFGMSIRARAPGRDLHRLDARAGQGRVGGSGELPGPVADREPEARGAVTEVHQEIADLLGRPAPVRVRGHPDDVHIAAADLHHEQAVQAAEGHRAAHVKEVDGQHRRRLRMEKLPPGRISCGVSTP